MGLRYRKSFNLGGGFRVNLSKSGIGYSWGGKGYRFTKTATGGTRRTFYIPGTGISWVDETGSGRQKKSSGGTKRRSGKSSGAQGYQGTQGYQGAQGYPGAQGYQGAATGPTTYAAPSSFVLQEASENEAQIISRLNFRHRLFIIGSIAVPIAALVLACTNGIEWGVTFAFLALLTAFLLECVSRVRLHYTFDSVSQDIEASRVAIMEALESVDSLRQVVVTKEAGSGKTFAGANLYSSGRNVQATRASSQFLQTNAPCWKIDAYQGTFYILPDRALLRMSNGWGVVNYDGLDCEIGTVKAAVEVAPPDAQIVDYTWRYVTPDGSPNSAYKENPKIPICLLGTLKIKGNGLDFILYVSNLDALKTIQREIKALRGA